MKLKILALIFLILSGCGKQTIYRQAGSDSFLAPFDASGKALVLVEAEGKFHSAGTMLVGFAKLLAGKSQFELYESKTWEFATYPGASIPFYAGEEPHALHAYLLEPGIYAVVRCVYGEPELDYCPADYWTRNGVPVGIAFFEVSAGDVINTGKLHVARSRIAGRSIYDVSIINNQADAKKYIESKLPNLAERLVYKPMQFTRTY